MGALLQFRKMGGYLLRSFEILFADRYPSELVNNIPARSVGAVGLPMVFSAERTEVCKIQSDLIV